MARIKNKMERDRKLFCEIVLNKQLTITDACKQFGFTRPTGYLWLKRYEEEGEKGLQNRSQARHSQNSLSHEIEDQILMIKYEFPKCGPLKIHAKLTERYPELYWPCVTTIEKILNNNGLVQRRKLRRRMPVGATSLKGSENSNEIWCMDFKGWRLTKDQQKFEPFTISDHYTRYLISCKHLSCKDTNHVWALLDLAFREYGLPLRIRSDNGPPFATCNPGRISPLTIKLIKAGIIPEWIDPGKPQQNGRHERIHLTMEQEAIFAHLIGFEEQLEKMDAFQIYYNFERPHQALDQQTPGSLYVPSQRIWTGKLEPLEYSNEYKIGKVSTCGKMWWANKHIYIGRVFTGEYLGVKEEENGLAVYFGPIFLGLIKGNVLEVKRRQIRMGRREYKKKI